MLRCEDALSASSTCTVRACVANAMTAFLRRRWLLQRASENQRSKAEGQTEPTDAAEAVTELVQAAQARIN